MKNKKILLYRGVEEYNSSQHNYINLSNSIAFSKNYGNIILVYSLDANQEKKILEESIFDRQENILNYSKIIQKNKNII